MYVLRNLRRFTWYEIRIQPFYLTVEGHESNTVRVRTAEDCEYYYQVVIIWAASRVHPSFCSGMTPTF